MISLLYWSNKTKASNDKRNETLHRCYTRPSPHFFGCLKFSRLAILKVSAKRFISSLKIKLWTKLKIIKKGLSRKFFLRPLRKWALLRVSQGFKKYQSAIRHLQNVSNTNYNYVDSFIFRITKSRLDVYFL